MSGNRLRDHRCAWIYRASNYSCYVYSNGTVNLKNACILLILCLYKPQTFTLYGRQGFLEVNKLFSIEIYSLRIKLFISILQKNKVNNKNKIMLKNGLLW